MEVLEVVSAREYNQAHLYVSHTSMHNVLMVKEGDSTNELSNNRLRDLGPEKPEGRSLFGVKQAHLRARSHDTSVLPIGTSDPKSSMRGGIVSLPGLDDEFPRDYRKLASGEQPLISAVMAFTATYLALRRSRTSHMVEYPPYPSL
jgi:hypothetical protein